MLLKLLKAEGETTGGGFPFTDVSLVVRLQAIQLLEVLLTYWVGSSKQQTEVLVQVIRELSDHVLLTKPDNVLEAAYAIKDTSGNTSIKINVDYELFTLFVF